MDSSAFNLGFLAIVIFFFIVNQGFIRYKDSIKVFALIKTDFVKV